MKVDRGRFAPIAGDTQDSYLARVNMAVLYDFNAFGVLGASSEAPGQSVVASLANALNPYKKDGHWKADPIMAEPDIAKFQRAKRVRRVQLKADVLPSTLFSEEGSWGATVSRLSDGLAGADIELGIELRIKSPGSYLWAQERLKTVAKELFEGLRPKQMKVSSTDAEFDNELIRLAQYRLTAAVDLPAELEPRLMCSAVADAAADCRERVKDWVDIAQS